MSQRQPWRVAAAVAMGAALLAACVRTQDLSLSRSGLRGAELDPPLAKPPLTLVGPDGRLFDFRRETAGSLTLLFFGYTHCPDVCPVTLANISAVLHTLSWNDERRIKVVFVTTDPARDTADRLRHWLANFDSSFIGLTGSPAALRAAQVASGLLPAQREPAGETYFVGHAAQVLVFTPDNLERAQYPSDTRQEDWAHDIPRLLAFGGHS